MSLCHAILKNQYAVKGKHFEGDSFHSDSRALKSTVEQAAKEPLESSGDVIHSKDLESPTKMSLSDNSEYVSEV